MNLAGILPASMGLDVLSLIDADETYLRSLPELKRRLF